MPNLQAVIEDPALLESSVETMMGYKGSRGEVCLNHGIRTSEELDAHVAKVQGEGADVDVATYRRLLGLSGQ